MRQDQVRTPEQALAYITDCCIATVEAMAMKKSRPKGEFSRQIAIAQKACNWMQEMNIDPRGTRAEEIIGHRTVEEWAKQFIAEKI